MTRQSGAAPAAASARELCTAFLDTATLLDRLLSRAVEDRHGMSRAMLDVLLHLDRAPGGVLGIGELTVRTSLTGGGMTRLVDRLERRGLVRRRTCPRDRRVQLVGLTEAGGDLARRAAPWYDRLLDEYLAGLTEPRQWPAVERALHRLGDRVRTALES
ncbi:MarR family winged helix-turn-helix transcriptional regulator [Allostreptomyces psammosilenae]|uniref:DNA-binding MarR family transcriptional regulator n=1 Tax=Allostreptomyces psammosilenae TaxID=1892865 RepID=A0A852ZR03_9ACTN|nr:MarR family winged helix-turn-helix transcriptional regulator [Allostreptomyces psammosilenae]NYI03284.1 DNA-binding MarR family transcriptional regulator [Allostreptomyces psammosilenae]